jgi:hypothetical protein
MSPSFETGSRPLSRKGRAILSMTWDLPKTKFEVHERARELEVGNPGLDLT